MATPALLLSMAGVCPARNHARILQTNSNGDNIHIIDPATNKVVGEITGIKMSHGIAVAPDGKRIYISNESSSTLDVVDGTTLKVIKQIPLSARPNNIALDRQGQHVYVGIRQEPGGIDVIDTASLSNTKTIVTGSTIHNPYVTPDGKYLIAAAIQAKRIEVIDLKTGQVLEPIHMDLGPRPLAISKNPDGSTHWIFVQLSGLNGFAVVDFATRKEIKRILHPDLPPGRSPVDPGTEISHGMAVTPDQKTLLICSRINAALYSYSLPELKVTGTAYLGGKGSAWISLTPDVRRAYVANTLTDDVSVVDLKSMKEIARIHVGSVPKRNTLGMLP